MDAFKMWYIIALSLLTGEVARSQEVTSHRLPGNFKPATYRLDITTHLDDKFVFEGVVDIKVSTTK